MAQISPPAGRQLARLHLGAARDALVLAQAAFKEYEPHLMHGAQLEEHLGHDGRWDLEELRRYLSRGRASLSLACQALGLASIVPEIHGDILPFGEPRFVCAGYGGYDIASKDLSGIADWLVSLERHCGAEATSVLTEHLEGQLRKLLEGTSHLVSRRAQIPTGELDVQRVMHDYLGVCFPDFVERPSIQWPSKSFEPDGGIPSMQTAIEFKFVRTSDDVKRSIDQVFADATGYSGDGQWTRFWLVYYMTAPVAYPARIEATMRMAGLDNWRVITVGGGGAPPRKRAGPGAGRKLRP